MTVIKFDYTQTYTLKSVDVVTNAVAIFFVEEQVWVPGVIDETTKELYITVYTQAILKNRLRPTTKQSIKGLIESNTKTFEDDDLTLNIPSLGQKVGNLILAGDFATCRELLKIIPSGYCKDTTEEGSVQAFLTFYSCLGKTVRPHILNFVNANKDIVNIFKRTDPEYIDIIFKNFMGSSENKLLSKTDLDLTIKDILQEPVKHTTEEEIYFMFCIFTLFMSKSVTNESNYNTWYDNRRKAWDGTLNCKMPDTYRIPFSVMKAFRDYVDKLKDIRPTVMDGLISAKGEKGIKHILDMLAYSQMTMLSFMLAFINSPRKTYAHINDAVLDDLDKFFNHYDEIVEKYGQDGWKYYKVYEPSSSYFSQKSLPHLTYVSYLSAKRDGRCQSYQIGIPPINGESLANELNIELRVNQSARPSLDKYADSLKRMHMEVNAIKAALERSGGSNY